MNRLVATRTLLVGVLLIGILLPAVAVPQTEPHQNRPELVVTSGLAQVSSVAISPDGRTAVMGLVADQSAVLWDMATGVELRRLEGHTSVVFSVAFSPDGRTVLTGSWDETARLWDATEKTTLVCP